MRSAFVLIAFFLFATSCTSSDPPDMDAFLIIQRAGQVGAFGFDKALGSWQGTDDWVLSGAVPFEVGVVLGFQAANTDPFPRSHDNITRFEVDFGDGAGWQDVTADAGRWGYGFADPAHMTLYTYERPGIFEMRGRAVFFDGEVVESDDVVRVEVSGT